MPIKAFKWPAFSIIPGMSSPQSCHFGVKIPVIFRMLLSHLRAVVNLPPQRHRCPDRRVCLTIKEMIISIDEGKGPRTNDWWNKTHHKNWCLTEESLASTPNLCSHPKAPACASTLDHIVTKKTMPGSMLRGHFVQRWGARNHRCLVKRQVVLLLKEVRHQKNCCIAPGHRRDKGAETLRRGTRCMYRPNDQPLAYPPTSMPPFLLLPGDTKQVRQFGKGKTVGTETTTRTQFLRNLNWKAKSNGLLTRIDGVLNLQLLENLPKDPLSVLYP